MTVDPSSVSRAFSTVNPRSAAVGNGWPRVVSVISTVADSTASGSTCERNVRHVAPGGRAKHIVVTVRNDGVLGVSERRRHFDVTVRKVARVCDGDPDAGGGRKLPSTSTYSVDAISMLLPDVPVVVPVLSVSVLRRRRRASARGRFGPTVRWLAGRFVRPPRSRYFAEHVHRRTRRGPVANILT